MGYGVVRPVDCFRQAALSRAVVDSGLLSKGICGMTDEELNHWIAENVMGWKLCDRRAMGWGEGPPVYSTGEDPEDLNSSPTRRDPRFSTDPADDYLVLVKVRETWDDKQISAFANIAEEVWCHRSNAGSIYDWTILYEVGDWSRAAKAALDAKAAAKKQD